MEKLLSPVSYQGAKTRIAKDIIDIIQIPDNYFFCDLCCGSGAISLELVSMGFDPKQIIMVDISPWGLFWEEIGLGKFKFNIFEQYCKEIPKDLSQIKDFMLELSKQSTNIDTVPVFLLLQASSFGGKAIWIDKETNKWINCSFRNFWIPTETSKRRSVVNPMMPLPETILKRTELLMRHLEGISGIYDNCWNVTLPNNSIIYIDPPYQGTTKYGHEFNYLDYIKILSQTTYCSEAIPLTDESWLISSGREKGGISGNRGIKIYKEWLSKFN